MHSKNSTSTWRIFLGCWIIVSALVIGTWVMPHPTSSAVYAQPMLQSTLTPQAYLPLVMNNYCSGVGIKCWSGIHLGNRSNSDWNDTILQALDPVPGGTWPKAIVVLSSQIYRIQRYPVDHATYPCRVDKAEILMPIVFDYVKRAAQHGVRVIIRIYPSPGNFSIGMTLRNRITIFLRVSLLGQKVIAAQIYIVAKQIWQMRWSRFTG